MIILNRIEIPSFFSFLCVVFLFFICNFSLLLSLFLIYYLLLSLTVANSKSL